MTAPIITTYSSVPINASHRWMWRWWDADIYIASRRSVQGQLWSRIAEGKKR
jgi:hypothetical protein